MKQLSILLIFMTSVGLARIEKTYIDLLSVDGEKMSRQIEEKLRLLTGGISSRKRQETVIDALRLIFGRWDQDGFRDKIYQDIRREVGDDETLSKANIELADEALRALKRSSGAVKDLSTYVIILENMMAQIRPEIASQEKYFQLFSDIRDAKLKVSEQVQRDRRLRGLLPFESPSVKAEAALKGVRRPSPKKEAPIEDLDLDLDLDQDEPSLDLDE